MTTGARIAKIKKRDIRICQHCFNAKYQLAPLHQHRQNAAEIAIKTLKSHFLSQLATCNKTFPLKAQSEGNFYNKPNHLQIGELLLPFTKCSQRCQHQSLEKYFSVVM